MSLAGIGDNSGEVDIATQIADNLKEKDAIKALEKRAKELLETEAKIPEKVEDLDTAEKVSKVVAICMAFDDAAEENRKKEKDPYWNGGKAVDAFFAAMRQPIAGLKARLLEKRTAYDIAVEARERKRLKEEADKAAAAAAALAKDAETDEELQAADELQQKADTKQEAAQARPADLTRTRSSAGTTSSLKAEWKHEITDPKKVPRAYCEPDDKAIKKAIKDATTPDGRCTLEIKGVRIYEHKQTQVRR